MKFPSRLERGSILGGRYLIVRSIGSGGMSHVYMAEDMKLPGKKWAIKESMAQPGDHGNFATEAEMLIALQHPRLPQIVDFFEPDQVGYTYLVMDYIEGVTLTEYLNKQNYVLPYDKILTMIREVMDVLDYLHHRSPPIIYRDLKPGNIMITGDEDLRLIDFGIARNYKENRLQDTVKLGTIGFASPEQYGSGQTDVRSDLYSLGALFLYLVTRGAHSEWISGVEQMLRNEAIRPYIPVIRRLLRSDPANRYQSIHELREEMFKLSHKPSPHQEHGVLFSQGTSVVAVMGVGPGVGVTHTSIAIAHYLARLKCKVAIIELSQRATAFSRIDSIACGSEGGLQDRRMFELAGVHYFRKTTKKEILQLLSSNYQYVVLDLGCERNHYSMEELQRSDVPIVVGGAAEWKQSDLQLFSRSYESSVKARWNYVLPLSSKDTVMRIRKNLKSRHVYSLPLQLDPFDQENDVDEALTEILKNIIPTMKKRSFFFKMRS
ncbi:serine/threonine-protein kinase [Paenibacillus sp. Marseille-Q4541]|uniref:serine/threonine-protein kinase n=1 Tax=Paenibacillus sp. Marseille-Q4541 TaxID=2831522 RepID=UPI002018E78D|nr:serine/threonine-protein kinase [Paenibacillus sp. Marseille-Q4541]